MTFSVLAVAALVTGLAAATPPVQGDEAESLIREGIALRRAGKDDLALPKFQRAYELSRTPRAAVQVGLCEQSLGLLVEAEEHLLLGLRARGDAWVKKNRATIEGSLSVLQSLLGAVEVSGTPVGAEVLVNGKLVGSLPLDGPVRVIAGPVQVELRSAGFTGISRSVVVVAGKAQRVAADLERTALAATAPASPQRATMALPSEAPGSTSEPGTGRGGDAPVSPSRTRRTLTIGALALAIVGLAVGGYGYVAHDRAVDRFNGSEAFPNCRIQGSTAVDARTGMATSGCRDSQRSYQDAGRIALLGAIGAAVAGSGAVLLYITEPDAPAPHAGVIGGARWGSMSRRGLGLRLFLAF